MNYKVFGSACQQFKTHATNKQWVQYEMHVDEMQMFDSIILQQTACLVVNPITIGNFAFLFNCTPVGRTSDSLTVPT